MTLRIKNNVASVNTLRQLSTNQDALTKSLERLASGQKINRGADDPAGLVISENLRSQIAGIEQAVSNSEVSISMVQTAEGALTEVNNLLIQARQLSLAAANEGANDTNALLALQSQLKNALESIDRVSSNTRFGNKSLLDGSRGISGVANVDDLLFLGATVNTRSSPVTGFPVKITQLPSRSGVSSDFSDSDAEELVLSVTEGGKAITVVGTEEETAESFAGKLNKSVREANLDLEVIFDKDGETLILQHKNYGTESTFQVRSSKGGVLAESADVIQKINNGVDVKGSINGEAATGVGRVLVGNEGNRFTDGLAVLFSGDEVGEPGTVSVAQNSLVFQIGPNEGQRVRIAIDDTGADSLARGLSNESGFRSLADANITTAQGAEDTIRMMDRAINEISAIRGRLGAFQKNALETNTATLRVTAENLIAAESSIRDTDIAEELADFTKHQILTQTAAAANAQANKISNHSLLSLYGES
ncbi:MAG: flagellin [SAR324 cluster bacterium]|nr:flagellin [SAR324 cluster bacterium]